MKPWGLLTLDALEPGCFAGDAPLAALQAFSDLASATVATAARMRQLEHTAAQERQRAEHFRRRAPASTALLGHSSAMQTLLRDMATVAASDLPVLITGETGVGKELVAQALHAQSQRADQAFVSINCAALPEQLVESELFGHVRGAFTGALHDRAGKFEQAHQGTLFLDEVGELPLATQAKLLRVLQSGHIQRLGLDRERTMNVRIIAAANQDLEAAVHQGRMRADFFHRLNVFPITVPPLRAREGDVLLLAGHFLERARSDMGLEQVRLTSDAHTALLDHAWPGNVRELEHCMRRSVLHALRAPRAAGQAVSITAADLKLPTAALRTMPLITHVATEVTGYEIASASPTSVEVSDLAHRVDQFKRALIAHTLQAHHHNLAAAARSLQVDRSNLLRLCRRLGISTSLEG